MTLRRTVIALAIGGCVSTTEALGATAMSEMMGMDDTARVGTVLLDQFEWRHTGNTDAAVWEAQGWYGGDYNKLWIRSEGEREDGTTREARADLLWDHVVSRWWSLQTGLRQDFGAGPSRTWAAAGLRGTAPYGATVEGTFYLGDQGRTAARFKIEYDALLTQHWILQPEAEAELYGKSDAGREIGSGLANLDLGLRLRYEIRREIAPYLGVAWTRRRGPGADTNDMQFVAGIRAWY